MKLRKFLAAAAVLSIPFTFTGCMDLLDILLLESSGNGYNTPGQDKTITDVSGQRDNSDFSSYVYNLDDDENSITLSGVKDKIIMYSAFNAGTECIPVSRQSYVTSKSGITENYLNMKAFIYDSVRSVENEAQELSVPDSGKRHFIPDTSDLPEIHSGVSADARSVNAGSRSVTANDFGLGESKYFYVDTNVNVNKYEKKRATLQAKNEVCLVWVVDNCYTTDPPSGKKINTTMAQELATKFAAWYETEQNLFGEESDIILTSKGYNYGYSLNAYSDTGTLVNIVVYDIGNDYGKTTTSGVIGYFHSKDYFLKDSSLNNSIAFSNEGKYFYMDSSFCNESNNGHVSNTSITTLFHEFQHMINFNQKVLLHKDIDSVPVWYNEMLSMLAEDVLAEKLGVADKDAPWGSRLPSFNNYYIVSGIDEYRNDDLSVYSYSTSYAFGAWLARNFGGAKFIHELSTNDTAGMESVTNAIYKLTGERYTALELYKMFIQACVFRNSFSPAPDFKNFNKSITTTVNGTDYTLNSIDLFSRDFANKWASNDYNQYKGPFIAWNGQHRTLSSGYNLISDGVLRPHGFAIYLVGKTNSNTDTITLNFKSHSSAEKITVYIQDDVSNKY